VFTSDDVGTHPGLQTWSKYLGALIIAHIGIFLESSFLAKTGTGLAQGLRARPFHYKNEGKSGILLNKQQNTIFEHGRGAHGRPKGIEGDKGVVSPF
jgi:hypothetical protein